MTEDAIERLLLRVRAVVREELSELSQAFEEHQREEIAHHKRVDLNLKALVKFGREQRSRLNQLEARVAGIEDKEPA